MYARINTVVSHDDYEIEMDYRMASIDDDKIVFFLFLILLTHTRQILSSNWNDMDFFRQLWRRQWLESGFRDFYNFLPLLVSTFFIFCFCLTAQAIFIRDSGSSRRTKFEDFSGKKFKLILRKKKLIKIQAAIFTLKKRGWT